jgi:3-mercaptopropionate dioxygenase
MAVETSYRIEHFIADVKGIVAADGATESGLAKVAALMRRLTARDDLYPGLAHADLTDDHEARRLHAEPDGSLMLSLARFSADEPTRVHNHNSWGVAGIYKGTDLYLKWERRDDGARPGYAEVEPVEERLLRRGDTTYWLDAPHDLHSQWGQEGHVAWELVLMGKNNQGLDRLFFEPARNEVWAGPATELRSASGGYRPPARPVVAAVEAFARDVERILAGAGDRASAVEQVRPLLAGLMERDDLLDDRYKIVTDDGRVRYSFYRSPDGRLTIGGPIFEPGRPTFVHNHNTWGVIGIYSGAQRTGRFRRTDDGATPGRASLVKSSEDVLGPGSIYYLLPPDDIHQIEAVGQPSLSIHVLGVDLKQQHRQFFDVEAGTYRDVLGEGVMT